MRNAYGVVEEFERRMAEFSSSKYAVAVDSCTNAIQLCAEFIKHWFVADHEVTLPARTYCSVPMALIHAGFRPVFQDFVWEGIYPITFKTSLGYQTIIDGAKRYRPGMYSGALFHCLSFHIKKSLDCGTGGMILTDSKKAVEWLKLMRWDGRQPTDYGTTQITKIGHHMYMTPEIAARGIRKMEALPLAGVPDQLEDYPDLRKEPAFQDYA